ncbi:uncharacterized protein TNIN_71521 [Trichonephila inaurata madagascariensis]|uniref:Uncharacterized protein n=1 Tax=Trichonephila inaurata madagascariensis TaxID=2747483 RepID=A0A8X6IUG4_9ARAC|nr:uncharacterized protein TNIN_71521 [Trichonephila inaurata madagascariensis]
MKCLYLFLILISVFAFVEANEEVRETDTRNEVGLKREGRNNYDPYMPKKMYNNIGEYKEEFFADSEPSHFMDELQTQGSDPYGSNKYKDADRYKDYNPPRYPPFPNNYKGYPFYPNGHPSSSAEQVLHVMALVNKNKVTSKSEGSGLLSKLIAEPSIAAAVIIPLSFAAAAVVPAMMNLVMGGTSTPMISTIANNREARSIDISRHLISLIQGKFRSQAMEE